MLKYSYKHKYICAIEKEIDGLYSKGTFTLLEHTTEKLLPLIYSHKEVYAATLVAQTFRAIMALTAAYDLETQQYDAVLAFLNAKLDKLIPCVYPPSFTKPGFYLLATHAIYGLP
jgi:hypothetical protein